MPDILVNWLNNFSAGNFFLAVIALVAFATTVGKKIWKLSKDATSIVEANLKKKEEYQDLLSDVENVKTEIAALKTDSEAVKEKLKSATKDSDESDAQLKRAITAAEEMASKHANTISQLEKDIQTMQTKINLLFASDKEFCKSYIIDGYNRYVLQERTISLMALQNIEGMYNRYQQEHGDDEFLGKIMREIRNLPTINR